MIVVPYQATHMKALVAQRAQQYLGAYMTPEYCASLESTLAFAAIEDGTVLGCGGLMEMWAHRALVWSFVGANAGKHFTKIHRAVKEFIDNAPYRRIEAEVDVDFAPGHRWARMLGFTLEAERMKCFRVDGGDSALYAKVK